MNHNAEGEVNAPCNKINNKKNNKTDAPVK